MITTKEMAYRLKVSPRTVRRMATDGRLTPVAKLPGPTGNYLFDEPTTDSEPSAA